MALPAVPSVIATAAELRPVSVLFIDLVGFTSLSELRGPEDVRELLGRYFETARTIIERHGGVVEKFIGDAVMAVWGLTVAREDDAERAVRAALAVVEAVAVFGERVDAVGLAARAGVVTGQAAALDNPGEGLVVGDRVNTASRVQAVAAAGTVLVDETTTHLTGAAIAFEDTGEHLVKGKAQPLRLWRAMRVIAGIGGSDREPGFQAPFVGRDGDLWLLKELFHGALERRSARLVAVTGEAGVGKSRLRREFFNYVDGLSDTVLWHFGRCLSFGDGVAYSALAEMVRQRFGIAEETAAPEAALKLAEGLDRWVGDSADREFLKPRLGALLGVDEPGLARDELFSGWRLFFERLTQHLPVVLVFEDLQWADAGLLDFIGQLLDWSASNPIFILTLDRPDTEADRGSWTAGRPGAIELPLAPLGEPAMRALLAGVVDGLPDQAAARIMERAQGVPLYAIEIVRALADRGVIVERDGRLVLAGQVGALDVPASLSLLLAARLDALDPVERGFVKAMSVLGGSFARSTAAAVGGVEESQLDAVLASLVRKQVLVIRADRLSPERGQYAFAQELLRTVAYETLSRRERTTRHLAAAEHLRHSFPDDGEDVAEVIASHYLDAYRAAGQDPEAAQLRSKALTALRQAARRAASVGAPEAAERSYLAARELADGEDEHTELTQRAGEMALQSGHVGRALELLEAAIHAHRAAGRERDAARLAGDLGLALDRLGRLQEAVERLRAALQVLGGDRLDPDVAKLNVRLGHALVFLGDYQRAEPPLDAALATAEALDLPAVLADALSNKALIYKRTGRPQQARALWTAATEIDERHHLSAQLALVRTNLGNQSVLWDSPDAEEQTLAGLTLSRRRGDRAAESFNGANLMMMLLLAGRWPEVDELAGELLEDNESRPAAESIHFVLAILRILRGELSAARASLERMAADEHTEEEEGRACHAAITVSLLLAEGQPEQALEHGELMLAHVIDTLGINHESVRQAWPNTVQAALRLGRHDAAQRMLALLADQPRGNVSPFLGAQLVRGRALLEAARGCHEDVETGLATAIDAFRKLSYPYWLAVTQTELATWLAGQDRASEAGALTVEAIETLESLRAEPALLRAQQLHDVGGRSITDLVQVPRPDVHDSV